MNPSLFFVFNRVDLSDLRIRRKGTP